MHPEFCHRLRARELLLGTMCTIDSIAVMEILCDSGFDWIFIEAEHAPNGMAALERLIVAAKHTPCLVRLPNHEPTWIKRALDLGAAGIIVPQVNTPEQAQAIAQAARFTPTGERGLGISRATRYGYGVVEYLEQANAGTAVMVQAEHVDAIANATAIAEVDGIDGVFIGPYDLSASMGCPGQIDSPQVRAAISKVHDAFATRGKAAGYFSTDPVNAQQQIAAGFNLVACNADVVMLRHAATALNAQLREN